MNTPFTFHKTAVGYSHIKKGTDTEDASDHLSSENGRYHIAVISDGHGDKNCFRSSIGSKAVVACTMKMLKVFAEGLLYSKDRYEGFLADKSTRQRAIKKLTDSIFIAWNEEIEKHLLDNPPTEEEYAACATHVADMYRAGQKTSHIYGATLIAALQVDDCLILIQQGDGRCDVFYEDGSVNQPIPWDEQCHENVTTSMCDTDAHLRIRHCVIDTCDHPVIACYVGSDGVEDSFPDNDEKEQLGTHRFYKELTCHVLDLCDNEAVFDAFLGEHLSHLSKVGSADDVSVSGIVFTDKCRTFYQQFKNEVSAYELDFQITDLESKIAVMGRKHTILHKWMLDAKQKYEEALLQYEKNKKAFEALQGEAERLTQKRKEAEAQYAKYQSEAQTLKSEGSIILGKLDSLKERLKKALDDVLASLGLEEKKVDFARQAEKRALKDLEDKKLNLTRFEGYLKTYWQDYQNAVAEFDAFDETRKGYERRLDELLAQKQALLNPAAARIYEDISSFSCDKAPGLEDARIIPADVQAGSDAAFTPPPPPPIPSAPTIPKSDVFSSSPAEPVVSTSPAPCFTIEDVPVSPEDSSDAQVSGENSGN